jgi:hypothetical protein
VVASLNKCELIDVSRAAWNNSVEMYNLHELMDEEYHKDIAARDAMRGAKVEPSAQVTGSDGILGEVEVKEVAELDPKEKKVRTIQKKVSAELSSFRISVTECRIF